MLSGKEEQWGFIMDDLSDVNEKGVEWCKELMDLQGPCKALQWGN